MQSQGYFDGSYCGRNLLINLRQKGTGNIIFNHLSRLGNIKPEHVHINDDFPYDRLVPLVGTGEPNYAHFTDYFVKGRFSIKNETE